MGGQLLHGRRTPAAAALPPQARRSPLLPALSGSGAHSRWLPAPCGAPITGGRPLRAGRPPLWAARCGRDAHRHRQQAEGGTPAAAASPPRLTAFRAWKDNRRCPPTAGRTPPPRKCQHRLLDDAATRKAPRGGREVGVVGCNGRRAAAGGRRHGARS